MYYVYSKKSGRLLLKTKSIDLLKCYVPELVDVHYAH
jgi:hypothetical protein